MEVYWNFRSTSQLEAKHLSLIYGVYYLNRETVKVRFAITEEKMLPQCKL